VVKRFLFHPTAKCIVSSETSPIHAFAHLDPSGHRDCLDCLEEKDDVGGVELREMSDLRVPLVCREHTDCRVRRVKRATTVHLVVTAFRD
jgi:hypothetical protein